MSVEKDTGTTYAPWATDPDDPADSAMSPTEMQSAATAVAAMFPELVDKSGDGGFEQARADMVAGRDKTSNQQAVKVFNEAIAMLDASEPGARDMIEGGMFDVAGINRTKVGDGLMAAKATGDRVNAHRQQAIKKAFRHLRDNLPND